MGFNASWRLADWERVREAVLQSASHLSREKRKEGRTIPPVRHGGVPVAFEKGPSGCAFPLGETMRFSRAGQQGTRSGGRSLLPPEKTRQLNSSCSQLPSFCVTLASPPGQRPPFPGRAGGLPPAPPESQWAPCSQIENELAQWVAKAHCLLSWQRELWMPWKIRHSALFGPSSRPFCRGDSE